MTMCSILVHKQLDANCVLQICGVLEPMVFDEFVWFGLCGRPMSLLVNRRAMATMKRWRSWNSLDRGEISIG